MAEQGRSPARASTTGGNLTAKYVIQTADASLPNAQVLGSLATGVVMNTTTAATGVLSIVTLSGLSLSGSTLSNDLLTATAGSKTVVGSATSAQNLSLSSNPSRNGQIFFGTHTNPGYFVDTTAAAGTDTWQFRTGGPSLGLKQVATFCSRGNALNDDVAIGFGGAGTAMTDGGNALSHSRLECRYTGSNNQDLRFFTMVSNVGTEMFRLDGTNGTFNILRGTTITDAKNIAVGTTTGTIIGTATTQKLGFWNATPVVQYSSTGTSTGFTTGAGTAVKDDSTFTGAVGSTGYRISDVVKALKTCGFMAQ